MLEILYLTQSTLFQPDAKFVSKHQIIKTKGIIALLPGSRKQELHYALPKYIEVARAFPEKTFGLSAINNLPSELYDKVLEEPNVIPVPEDNYNLLLNAEAAIVTSGTATLETAIFEVPQIVTYEGSKLSYEIARRLVKVNYISLVNLIADEEVVKEFIQQDFTPENLIQELKNILEKKQLSCQNHTWIQKNQAAAWQTKCIRKHRKGDLRIALRTKA
jgi:lipid-A-disaccharide synthase